MVLKGWREPDDYMRSGPSTPIDPGPEARSPQLVSPPVALLALGSVSTAVSVLLLMVQGQGAHLAGYVLGTIMTTAFIIGHRSIDERRRNDPRYSPERWNSRVAAILIPLGLIVSIPHLWAFATEIAK